MVRQIIDDPCITLETPGIHTDESNHFTVEASDLGLPVGMFPRTLCTTLGNGMVFVAQHIEKRDGDILWVDYFQRGRLSLRVYND